MMILTTSELEEMERLLARLLAHSEQEEERSAILRLHQRLVAIFENQKTLRKSWERLLRFTEQTFQ